MYQNDEVAENAQPKLVLKFQRPYASIVDFPDTTLPAFVLITGPNGSGKTHFLRAVETGAISIEGISASQSEIRYFDWNSMAPNDSGAVSSSQFSSERFNIWETIKNAKKDALPVAANFLKEARVLPPSDFDVSTVFTLNDSAFTSQGAKIEDVQLRRQQVERQITEHIQSKLNQQNSNWKRLVDGIEQSVGRPLCLLTEKDFDLSNYQNWGGAGAFQQQLSEAFVQYRQLQVANLARRGAREVNLSDQDFLIKYKRPPWEVVNEVLKDSQLPFEVNHPVDYDGRPFVARLTKRSTGAEILFSQLSSGERVLISFALCQYYARDGRQFTTYPKLLLFDEVDAPLHPAMAKYFVQTIKKTLVEKENLSVLATTHSPSTVALAPEDCLFVMQKDGRGLMKVSKSQALNILTVDVPTLAIDFSGRRQVFVESERDAEIYDKIFQILKSKLATERSLSFIGTGRKSQEGTDINTGSSVVETIVSKLSESGNQSTFGILDWDLHHVAKGRLQVLAEGERYAIENVVLDPLCLIAALIGLPKAKHHLPKFGLSEEISQRDFFATSPQELQKIALAFLTHVLGNPETGAMRPCQYNGDFSLSLPEKFLHMQGHSWEKLVFEKFPEFKAYQNDFLVSILDRSVREEPGLLPSAVSELFKRILEADIISGG